MRKLKNILHNKEHSNSNANYNQTNGYDFISNTTSNINVKPVINNNNNINCNSNNTSNNCNSNTTPLNQMSQQQQLNSKSTTGSPVNFLKKSKLFTKFLNQEL
jgi:hypothetical protein